MDNDPLKLRNLPDPAPPQGLWSAIAENLDTAGRDEPTRDPRPALLAGAWLPAAVAASLLVAVLVMLIASPLGTAPDRSTDRSEAPSALAQARSESAGLEKLLRHQRDGVLDASSVESLAWMETELGWLDLQLADSPADTGLWQQRVELLEQMAQQYERNSWQARIQLASY